MTRSFRTIVEQEKTQQYYQELHQFVENEYAQKVIFPPHQQIFRAFNLCDYNQVKVVILGQDPYHELNQANGLAFSVNQGVRFPPSLLNIYKEAMDDVHIDMPTSGDLTPWAKQGVLLLNTVLTVEEGKANSHKGKGWEIFTDHVIEALNEREKPLVFILWGRQARDKAKMIHSRHLIIESPHPSPLSAHRGFFGSKPFSRTNQFLTMHGEKTIDWGID